MTSGSGKAISIMCLFEQLPLELPCVCIFNIAITKNGASWEWWHRNKHLLDKQTSPPKPFESSRKGSADYKSIKGFSLLTSPTPNCTVLGFWSADRSHCISSCSFKDVPQCLVFLVSAACIKQTVKSTSLLFGKWTLMPDFLNSSWPGDLPVWPMCTKQQSWALHTSLAANWGSPWNIYLWHREHEKHPGHCGQTFRALSAHKHLGVAGVTQLCHYWTHGLLLQICWGSNS